MKTLTQGLGCVLATVTLLGSPAFARDVRTCAKASMGHAPGVTSIEASEQAVHDAVRGRMSAVRGCYLMAQRISAVQGGRLTVALEVTSAGSPSSVRIEKDTIGDAFLATCVTGVFERLRTAPLSLDRVALTYPLVFSGS